MEKPMDIIGKLKEELNVEKWQVEAAVKLIDEGNTIPFISRYRKEATGSLNDEVLSRIKNDTNEIILEFNRNNYNFVIESINKIIKNIISEI